MSTEDLFKNSAPVKTRRFPDWLKVKIPQGSEHFKTDALLKRHSLNLVCEEAKCPNRMECYANKTATFLALGKECTRSCGFCDIDFSKAPALPDPTEPERIALSALKLCLKHVVITMVSRDDLPDGGAAHIAAIIRSVRALSHKVSIETLTSDFQGDFEALCTVLLERPEVFNHNIETVRSLTPRVRHKATYERSLTVLKKAKELKLSRFVKSGLMVGLGESREEIQETLSDLHAAGCDVVTIGQYLQADRRKLLVKRFIPPEEFKSLKEYGLSLGIQQMFCGPFVRSSYHAAAALIPDTAQKLTLG